MRDLKNSELAILSLLAEGPKYGYQIEQNIASRGMRAWTDIAFSSIYYALNQLETAGWLMSAVEVSGKHGEPPANRSAANGARGPARRVYELTGQGWAALRDAVRARLAHPRLHSGDFDLALATLPVVPVDETRAALETYLAGLGEDIHAVRQKWAADRAAVEQAGGDFPAHVDALFSHSLAILQAEFDWVTNYLKDNNLGGKNG